MKKILCLIFLIPLFIGVLRAQTNPTTVAPANPQQMLTNIVYQDAVTKKYYTSNGPVFGWHQLTDSIQVARIIGRNVYYYQTVYSFGSAVPQQPILAFDAPLIAYNGSGQTHIAGSFDSTPLSGSINFVNSGAIYTALATKGSGSVTSITPGYGFTSSTPITVSGTLNIDTTKFTTQYFLQHNPILQGNLSVNQGNFNGGGINIGGTTGRLTIIDHNFQFVNNDGTTLNLTAPSGTAGTFNGTFQAKTGTIALLSDIPGGGGGTIVNSFNTRTGAVTLSSGDVTTALGYTPQATLVSGTNIKTVNSTTLLGSGNLAITTANTDTSSTGFATQKTLLPYLTKAQIVAGYSPIAGSSSITTVGTLSAGSIPYSLLTGTPSLTGYFTLSTPNQTVTQIPAFSSGIIYGNNTTAPTFSGSSGTAIFSLNSRFSYQNLATGYIRSEYSNYAGTSTIKFPNLATTTLADSASIAANYALLNSINTFAPTLNFSANNQTLVAEYINPTFNAGSYTGTLPISLKVNGNVLIGATLPSSTHVNKLNIVDNSTIGLAGYQNTNASGYSSFDVYDNNGTVQMSFGYGNGSAAYFPSQSYINFGGSTFIIAANGNAALTIANTKAATFGSSVTATSFVTSGGTSSQYITGTGALATTSIGANPSATIGLTAINGTATTFMTSDAAPALSQAITPTWTNTHTFSNATYSALFTGGPVGIGTSTPTAGYALTVNGYYNSTQTVDQNTYNTINAVQSASTLQDGSASSGTSETFNTTWQAIKFTASGNYNPRSFSVQLKSSATLTNTTATITGILYTDNSGVPGTAISGSASIRYGSLTTSFAEYQFAISTTLVSGTNYWIVLQQSAAPTGGTISINTTNSGTALFATAPDGVTWTTVNSFTGWFKLYGRTNTGVYGASTNYPGVQGNSTNFTGVQGNSTNSTGVYGSSTNATGVNGTSTNSTGVYGNSTNATGVYGTSTNSFGGQIIQNGTLTSANSSNTLYVQRVGVTNSTGSLNYTGNVLQLTDAPTGTGTWSGSLINGSIDGTTRLNFNPRATDGSTAVAYFIDTKTSLANATAKLFDVRNSGVSAFSVLANGGISQTGYQAINQSPTVVNCSTSGTANFNETQQGSAFKMVVITLSAALGTASYTYATAFTNTPVILTTSGLSASLVTTNGTSSITITGATSTGTLILMGN